MILLDASQIRAWDAYTIQHEPISSFDLMERAAMACIRWLSSNGYLDRNIAVFCGKGNNGGDGLAIARMLSAKGVKVSVYILEFGKSGTEDFQRNLQLLHETNVAIHFISEAERLPLFDRQVLIIDALLGTGINKPLEGLWKETVQHLNQSGNEIVSIDLPSGTFCDTSSKGLVSIKATHTISFQCFKKAFLVAENEENTGTVHILDIGLHMDFLKTIPNRMLSLSYLKPLFRKRKLFSHKGTHGHAALVVGSKGMMGAALLAAKACLRSGVGKLTCHIPSEETPILQIGLPEAICANEETGTLSGYDAVGAGPGLGIHNSARQRLVSILEDYKKPMVLDADALNIVSGDANLMKKVPPFSILTPHVKELERLFGKVENDFERINLVIKKAVEYQLIIILKGHFTLIAAPDGSYFFNSSGNPGMAKGGTGDVLTGIITAFLAQGYAPIDAACFGVHLHGAAADKAIELMAMESIVASDIIDQIGQVIVSYY